ncbi:MAG: hypothetical protein IKD72_04360 [Clostridia bacterium]|nr:hypothetical protein [Clostridia bacterium]
MKHWIKRIPAVIAALGLLLALCACGDKKQTVLVISGAELDREIYTYFLDRVSARPADYGLEETPSDRALLDAVTEQCKRYVANNTRFRDAGLTLSASEKAGIADQVNNLWIRAERHYKAIGVSKQTLTKVITAESNAEALFTATYDKGVTDQAGEAELLKYFYANYISFRTVVAYYTAADGSPLTQLQKNTIKEAFDAMAANAGESADSFREAAAAAGYGLSETILLKQGAEGYPEGFYAAVAAQENGTVRVLDYEDCVFAVLKEDLESKDESVYASYRSACVAELYAPQAAREMDAFLEGLTVKTAGDPERLLKDYRKAIKS